MDEPRVVIIGCIAQACWSATVTYRHEDTIRITYTFLYNLSDERELRAWQRQRWLEQKRQQGGG